MNTLISYFLPKAILQYSLQYNPNFHISEIKLRPFRSGLVVFLQDVSLENDSVIQCKNTQFFYACAVKAIHLRYFIPSSVLTIQTARVGIGGTVVELNDVSVCFSDSNGGLTITIGDIRVPSMLTIRRFDTPMNLTIRILNGVISVNVPEIRIYSHPSLQQIQKIQSCIQRIMPPDDPNAPPPKLHLSSLFIRHMITGWTKCISPISIGFSHTSVWEITEHIIRALTRI